MEEAKAVIPVKLTETEGSDARPKNERKEAYSPNWTDRSGAPDVRVAFSCWMI